MGKGVIQQSWGRWVLSHLPPLEARYLRTPGLQILLWGIVDAKDVDAVRRSLPDGTWVAGVRVRPEDAGRYHSEIPFAVDVVIAIHALAYWPYPLLKVEKHLSYCRDLYITVVPHNEYPLQASRYAQFRRESFPQQLEGFTRVCAQVLPHPVAGDQLLVIYASSDYLRRLGHPMESTGESDGVEGGVRHSKEGGSGDSDREELWVQVHRERRRAEYYRARLAQVETAFRAYREDREGYIAALRAEVQRL